MSVALSANKLSKSTSGKTYDRWLFFIAVTTGAIGIIFLKSFGISQALSTAFPVAIMIAYMAYILLTPRFRLREDQAGDHIYYMGFLFTLTSLSVALYSFSSGSDGTDGIIRNFGIALATTIVGLAGRIIINSMREDPVETEREARLELADAASRLKGEMDSSVLEFNSFRRATQQAIAESMEETAKHANNQLSESAEKFSTIAQQVLNAIDEAFSNFSENAKKLNNSSKRTITALDRLINKVEEIQAPTDMIERKVDPVIGKLSALSSSIESLTKADHARWNSFMGSVEALETSISNMNEFSNAFSLTLERVNTTFDKVGVSAEKVQKMEEGIVSSTSNVAEALGAQLKILESLTRSATHGVELWDEEIKGLFGQHRNQVDLISKMANDKLQAYFESLENDVLILSTSVGQLASISESQLNLIEEHNTGLRSELEQARNATIEVEQALVGMINALAKGLRNEPEITPLGFQAT